jgi:hypothetical protein
MLCVYIAGVLWYPHAYIYIYIYPWVLLVQNRVAALLRFIGSVSNLLLLTIDGYYYHCYIHDKVMERKWWPGRDRVWVLVGVTNYVPWPRGIIGLHCFHVHVIKDRSLHGPWSSHRFIIPSTYLLMGVGRLVTLLSWAPALSEPTDWRRG